MVYQEVIPPWWHDFQLKLARLIHVMRAIKGVGMVHGEVGIVGMVGIVGVRQH